MKQFPDDLSRAFGRADKEFVYQVQCTVKKLGEEKRKERTMNKRIPFGVILFLAILLLAMGTAIALTIHNWKHIETAMDIAVENGAYWEWSLNAKIRLIEAMAEDGLQVSEGDMAALKGDDLTEDEKQELADRILTEQYGEEHFIYYYTIAVAEWGEPQTWTLEQRYWFFKTEREKGLYLDNSWIDLLPEETDLTRDEVVRIAREAVRSAYGMTDEEIESYAPNVSFFITDVCDTPRWMVEFYTQGEDGQIHGSPYSVLLTRDGEVTEDWENLGVLTPAQARLRQERQKETAVDVFTMRGQMRLQDQNTVFWNPEGGKHYHFLADCPMVNADKLPLKELPVWDAQFGLLTPCPCCVSLQDFWSLKDKLRYDVGSWKYPGPDWISEEVAVEKARAALEEEGCSLVGLYPAVYSTGALEEEDRYIVYFDALLTDPDGFTGVDPIYYAIVDACSGEVVSCGESESNG